MKTRTHVILITETTLQSWARDAGTLAMFIALIGIGVWLGSAAMQWVGANWFGPIAATVVHHRDREGDA